MEIFKEPSGEMEHFIDPGKCVEVSYPLEDIKKKLETIFDGMDDGIYVINKEYEITRVNKPALNIFGKRDFSEILGRKCFSEIYQRDVLCDNCPAKKTFEEGIPGQLAEVSKDIGKKRVKFSLSTFPIKDKHGNVLEVVEHIKDITKMVELEERLLYSDRLAGMGELAAGIAHEIRNPLGNIKSATQYCLNKYELDGQIRKHFKIILKNSDRVNRVIKVLLNLAKPHEVSFKTGCIGRVIESVCSFVNARCLKQNIRLIKRFPRRLPQIFLDENLLQDAFMNFILNALDSMPKGGRLAITAYYDHDTEEIITSFADSGCGILEDNLCRIFDPFFTTKKDGTGLGLSLAKQAIELHKGKIHIESKSDYGTEVTVRIPVYEERVSEDG